MLVQDRPEEAEVPPVPTAKYLLEYSLQLARPEDIIIFGCCHLRANEGNIELKFVNRRKRAFNSEARLVVIATRALSRPPYRHYVHPLVVSITSLDEDAHHLGALAAG